MYRSVLCVRDSQIARWTVQYESIDRILVVVVAYRIAFILKHNSIRFLPQSYTGEMINFNQTKWQQVASSSCKTMGVAIREFRQTSRQYLQFVNYNYGIEKRGKQKDSLAKRYQVTAFKWND